MNNTMDAGVEPNLGYSLFFGSVLAVGLPLNAIALWILLRHHSLRTPSAVFMVNLAISDLMLVISLPMRVYFYATGTWPLSKEACTWITMLFRDNIRSSSIFITFISVDRLLAVVYPLRSRHLRTASNALKAVALAWLFVLVINIPERVELSRLLERYNKSICFEYHSNPHHPCHGEMVIAYVQSGLILTMLAVNIVCTTLVSRTLHKHLSDSARVSNKVNVMLIFVLNLVMSIICFLPVSIGPLFLGTLTRKLTPLTCLATVNCCLDPLLYYFSLDAFWKKKEDAELPRGQ